MITIIFIFYFLIGRDTLPPQVTGTFPANDSTIPPYYSIFVGFTQEMDSSSFDSSAVEIISSSGNLPKIIVSKLIKKDSIFTIFIYDYWQPYDTIQVTIKGYVKGKNGLTLDGNGNGIPEGSPIDDYTFKFFTGDYGFLPVPKDSFPFYAFSDGTLPHPDLGNLMDINNDGDKEIIYTWIVPEGGGIKVGAIDKDAKLLPNFPVFLEGRWYNGLKPCAIADLNGDKHYEIIPNVASQQDLHTANFYIITSEGNFFPNWPRTYHNDSLNFSPPLHETVICYDLDNDNELEIIFPVRPNYIFIFEKNGELWNNYPLIPEGWLMCGMAIGDLNNDLVPEIIINTLKTQCPSDTYIINVLEPDGTPFPNFPKKIRELGISHPVLGDINNDSFLEIIFCTTNYIYPNWYAKIHALNKEGNYIPNFPVTIVGENFFYSICLGDINGDTIPEIVAATGGQDWIPELYIIKGDGTIIPGFPITIPGTGVLYPCTIVDINDDGKSEIVVTSEGGIIIPLPGFSNVYQILTYVSIFSNTGNIIEGFPIVIPTTTFNSPLISDIENDGYMDITVTQNGKIYSFTTPYTNYTLEWPLPYHDIHNTSNYHYIPPQISISELDKYKHLFAFSGSSITRNEFKFTLSLPHGLENKKLKILFYQVNGKKLKEFELLKIPRKFEYSINLKNLRKGIYFYIFKIENREIVKGKFIKI